MSAIGFSREVAATSWSRMAWLASLVLFAAMPTMALVFMFYDAIATDGVAFDFRIFYVAAEAALRGETLYMSPDDPALEAGRAYVYPPLAALLITPLTVLPMEAAGLVVMVLLVAAAVAVPWILGVRDWRCLGLVLLWPPVISAIQTGSVSLFLALGAALVWRFRERPLRAGLALAVAFAVKLLLWPVALWLAVSRRFAGAVYAVVGVAVLLVGSWAVVAFDGLRQYPELLGRLSEIMDDRGYTIQALALEYGSPRPLASALWLIGAVLLLAGVVVYGRRGDDRAAFVLAIAASLACTPIVWLHYFALLLVPVAVSQPRLAPVWFVPLALFLTPGSGDPTPFQTTATIAAVVATLALALYAVRGAPREVWASARTHPQPS